MRTTVKVFLQCCLRCKELNRFYVRPSIMSKTNLVITRQHYKQKTCPYKRPQAHKADDIKLCFALSCLTHTKKNKLKIYTTKIFNVPSIPLIYICFSLLTSSWLINFWKSDQFWRKLKHFPHYIRSMYALAWFPTAVDDFPHPAIDDLSSKYTTNFELDRWQARRADDLNYCSMHIQS